MATERRFKERLAARTIGLITFARVSPRRSTLYQIFRHLSLSFFFPFLFSRTPTRFRVYSLLIAALLVELVAGRERSRSDSFRRIVLGFTATDLSVAHARFSFYLSLNNDT